MQAANHSLRFVSVLALLSITAALHAADSARPNVIVILADDMGIDSVSALNDKMGLKTPAIDQLMREGMSFTDAHSTSGVCSPTRYSVLAGRYNWRSRLKRGIVGKWGRPLIEARRLTLPEMFRANGYDTACIGKWHLGWHWPKKGGGTTEKPGEIDFTAAVKGGPNDHGFDYYYGDDVPNWPPYAWRENDRVLGEITTRMKAGIMAGVSSGPAVADWDFRAVLAEYTKGWCQYIRERTDQQRPFFLYAPMPSPHTPIAPHADFRGRSKVSEYADFLIQTDSAVGAMMRALQETKQADDTLVIFTCDNGTSPKANFAELDAAGVHLNEHWRGWKADAYEGGHRVPFIVRWPGQIEPGTRSEQTITLADIMATCADVVGYELPADAAEDSVSLLPTLQDEDTRQPLHELVVHHSVSGHFAVRKGKWKLLLCRGSGGWSPPREDAARKQNLPPVQLYNLHENPKETTNLQADYPQVVQQLTADLRQVIQQGRSTPGPKQPNHAGATWWPGLPWTKSQKEQAARKTPQAVFDSFADEPIYDIVVYGDSSGAVTAAVAAKRQGRSVILVSPTRFLGGMSASGLGATDFLGKRSTFGGIASEFYDAIAAAYGKKNVRSFEPHVGRRVFDKLVAEADVPVVFNEKLNRETGVKMDGRRIVSITTLSGKTYRGRMFIDATYVGDLMAAAGVTYTVGREAENKYGENLAGVRRGDAKPRAHYTQGDKDHFIKEVDPYITPGDPSSGLLPFVFQIDNLTNGQGDRKIQAYNYRVCLTTGPKLRIPIEKPAGYREIDHELLLRNFEAGDHRVPALIEPLAGLGSKVDWNSMHAVGSDYAGANWEYPEASYPRRREIEAAHQTYIRGFLWTLANSQRVPAGIRKQVSAYGLPRDEFTDNGGWPYMIYIREARRMVSDYVMTQQDCQAKRAAADPVGLGSFGMDSHVVQYYVNEKGHVRRDGTIWRVPPKPYGISYRSIVPRKGECENLLVPVCLSASHVAHGSIRMEPVFMVLGQSAATAAGVALDDGVGVQEVAYTVLRERLEADRQIVHLARWTNPKQVAPRLLRQTSQSETWQEKEIGR